LLVSNSVINTCVKDLNTVVHSKRITKTSDQLAKTRIEPTFNTIVVNIADMNITDAPIVNHDVQYTPRHSPAMCSVYNNASITKHMYTKYAPVSSSFPYVVDTYESIYQLTIATQDTPTTVASI
jgi:hypothetical protein